MVKRALMIVFAFGVCGLSACSGEDSTSEDVNMVSDMPDMVSSEGEDDGGHDEHDSGVEEASSFCCAGDQYYECTTAQGSYVCGDTSGCELNVAKNRVCEGGANAQPLGASCSDAFECKGGACRIRPDGNYCTVSCSGDQECPLGWSCYGSNNKICIKPGE